MTGYGTGISIHTTARVVTNNYPFAVVASLISIHTTARVVTLISQWYQELIPDISIHTTARVVTHNSKASC